MRKLASKFASALLIPTALLLASASPALALQVVEGSDGVSVEAVLSIKEATRIRVDGAPITNVFGNIYSTNCGATITTAVPPQPGASPAPATGMVNPAGEIVLERDVDKGEIYVRPVGGHRVGVLLSLARLVRVTGRVGHDGPQVRVGRVVGEMGELLVDHRELVAQ